MWSNLLEPAPVKGNTRKKDLLLSIVDLFLFRGHLISDGVSLAAIFNCCPTMMNMQIFITP